MKWKLPRKMKKKIPYYKRKTKEYFEFYFFPRRIDVRAMEVCLNYPTVPATNDELLEWYKKHYPKDKLAHHFCKQNRHRWDKFNTPV